MAWCDLQVFLSHIDWVHVDQLWWWEFVHRGTCIKSCKMVGTLEAISQMSSERLNGAQVLDCLSLSMSSRNQDTLGINHTKWVLPTNLQSSMNQLASEHIRTKTHAGTPTPLMTIDLHRSTGDHPKPLNSVWFLKTIQLICSNETKKINQSLPPNPQREIHRWRATSHAAKAGKLPCSGCRIWSSLAEFCLWGDFES